jgi:hypothetical protein
VNILLGLLCVALFLCYDLNTQVKMGKCFSMGGSAIKLELHLCHPPLKGVMMTKLYIANCTKQNAFFEYSILENPRRFAKDIRAGGQIEIDNNADTLNYIIGQHERYGFVEVSKVGKGFSGLCYRFDKPISISAIEAGMSQNEQDMIDRAFEARKIQAVVTDQIISKVAQEGGLRQRESLEVEVVEEKRNFADNEDKFEQTITVQKEGIAPKTRNRRKA